ncbi:MAG: NAD(P)H-dependent oxidoreductase [Chloroflexi bacterium]|nr:NAD(P)H-dependent oxidoreductase [Chloroflexota bacterium]MDA1004647.1 NAD(P)H-dependent oxidoreductase [Chloroflexota bacterium]
MAERPRSAGPLAVAVPGSPSPTSGSRRLAEAVLARLSDRGWRTEVIDLGALAADALLGRVEDATTGEAVALAGAAQVLVVATPMYRATYSGLLKCFFDLMPPDYLAGKACVLVATGAAQGHLLAVDHAMRPLVASLGGVSVAIGIYATAPELAGDTLPPALAERLDRAAAEADRLGRALAGDGG